MGSIKLVQKLRQSLQKVTPAMAKVLLHLGAHRCATTTFQHYLDDKSQTLLRHGTAVWTPKTTRDGVFDSLVRPPEQEVPQLNAVQDHIRSRIGDVQADRLLISEENMIGTPLDNLSQRALYPGITPRLERFKAAFGQVTRIGLAVRSYDRYWASLLAFSLLRGGQIPKPDDIAALAAQRRTWCDVVGEIRHVFPNTQIQVWPFENFAHRPDSQFKMMTGLQLKPPSRLVPLACKNYSRDTHNLRRLLRKKGWADAANMLPKGRQPWMPFSKSQIADMAIAYADDLMSLHDSKDPMIQFKDKAVVKVLRLPDPGGQHEFTQQMG